ncbi:hypothetical protein NQZ79_g1368 [Umbelopsis isabellina]|nr:hypothetical protein NQZ79_g1368 [Umbelopsis isabellina]
MSNNPGKGTSSIYQENKDAFSSQLDLSTSRHLSPQAKANGQVNRLSKVFDTPTIHKDPHTPPPPPSKPQALRSSNARKTYPQDEPEAACESPSQSTVSNSSRSSREFCRNTPPQSPGMSFKDLQAKFQQAALDSDQKAPPLRSPSISKWHTNSVSAPSTPPAVDNRSKYSKKLNSDATFTNLRSTQTPRYAADQQGSKDRPTIDDTADLPRVSKPPNIPAKPSLVFGNSGLATEISHKLERESPAPANANKKEDIKSSDSQAQHSPKMSNVYKNLPAVPNPNRPPVLLRSESAAFGQDGSLSKSASQRKIWMAKSSGTLSSPVPSSLASTPSLEIPIARSTTGNSVSSTASSSSTGSQTNGSHKRGRGYNGIGNFFGGGGSSAEDHHQSIKNSITIVSKEPMPQRDSISSSGSTRPSSSADLNAYSSQPVSPLLDGRDPAAKRSMKRYNVIKELVETERTFSNDMALLKEVYYDSALANGSILDKSDVKLLFSNLPTIVDFEAEFLALLEVSSNMENDTGCNNDSELMPADQSQGEEQGSCVGMAFMEKVISMSQIEHIYCEYCKKHETAVIRLQELETKPEVQAFFKSCQQQMQDRTTSWDLGSLLIKPVQRVLKYPLLLQQIRMLTEPTHPDFENLERATKEIQNVADRINEIKRRKDIVEKIVGDRRRTDVSMVHGINKTFTRRAQKFKQATGIASEGTQDVLFDALFVKFEEQQESARQLARDVQAWIRHVKENFESMYQFSVSLEDLYTSWGGVTVRSLERVKAFKECSVSFVTSLSRELEALVRSIIYTRIDSFLKLFSNPAQVIVKRSNKLIDYDRANGIKQKGSVPDKALQESADAYVSINAQLVDELPRFLTLSSQYFDLIVEELAGVQAKFSRLMRNEWKRYMFKGPYALAPDDKNLDHLTTDTIVSTYRSAMQDLEPSIQDIIAVNPTQWEDILGFQAPSPDNITPTSSIQSDQYFGSFAGGIRTPSLTSLPMSDGGLSSPFRRGIGLQSTGNSLNQDTGYAPNLIQVASPQANWVESSSVIGDQPLFERMVLFDCDAVSEDQLAVRQGDIVTIWQADDDEWWYASSTHTVTGEERWGWVLAAACH